MKLRSLVTYEAYLRPTNPGAAGSPTFAAIREKTTLQQLDPVDGQWKEIPVVYDQDSEAEAHKSKRELDRRSRR